MHNLGDQMKSAEYLEVINAATTAGELGELLALAMADPDLNRASEARIRAAVLNRLVSWFAGSPARKPGQPNEHRSQTDT